MGTHRTARALRPEESLWQRHELGVFLALAFLLSWSVWPLTLLNPGSTPMVPFGPAIAAVAAAGLAEGRAGVRRLLRGLARVRVGPGWYAAALLVPAGTVSAAAVLALAVGADAPARVDWSSIPLVLLSTVVVVGVFEELGWRGLALPLLQRRHGPLRAAVLLGAVWAAWHLPLLVADPTGQRPPAQFVVAVVAQSVVLARFYDRTRGSLPVVVLLHAAVNTAVRSTVPLFDRSDQALVWWCSCALWVVAAILTVVLLRGGPRAGGARGEDPRGARTCTTGAR